MTDTTPLAALAFRDAVPGDEHVVARAVRAICEVEGMTHALRATPADYARLMFGEAAPLRGVMAECDAAPVGCALWYPVISTYAGTIGMFVEDVFVEPASRGCGVGRAIFAELGRRALAAGCDRIVLTCKDDNVSALKFYARLGTEPLGDYTNHRLMGEALVALAAG